MPGKPGDPIDRHYRAFIENTYTPVPKDDFEKMIDSILTLVDMGHDRKQPLSLTLDFAAKMLFRMFKFREIAIGLKDKKDGLFRYEIILGFRKEVEDRYHRTAYTHEDMVSTEKYHSIRMGRTAEFFPVEGVVQEESDLFNRPFQLGAQRKAQDDFHEGDYIDVFMFSQNREPIGWFELANPMGDKLPPRSDIRSIELIVGICSSIVELKWSQEDALLGKPAVSSSISQSRPVAAARAVGK